MTRLRLKLSRLDPSKLTPGTISLFQGRRNTGKTTLLRQAMYWMRDRVDLTVAVTPTESSAAMFRTLMPASCVYDQGFDVSIVETLLATQRELLAQKRRPRNVLLVLDDCSFDSKKWREKPIADLARNGRHCHVTVMLTSQYAMDLGPDLRSQIDLVYALRDPIIQNRKRLHACYFGMLPFAEFAAAFEACTENFGALVLDQTVNTSEVTACVFWARAAPTLPPFRVAAPVFFKLEARETPRAPSTVEVRVPRRERAGRVLVDAI